MGTTMAAGGVVVPGALPPVDCARAGASMMRL
jgi:hypothetical protein